MENVFAKIQNWNEENEEKLKEQPKRNQVWLTRYYELIFFFEEMQKMPSYKGPSEDPEISFENILSKWVQYQRHTYKKQKLQEDFITLLEEQEFWKWDGKVRSSKNTTQDGEEKPKKPRAPRKQKETVEGESQPSDGEKPKKPRAPRKQKETVEGESQPSDEEKPKKPRATKKVKSDNEQSDGEKPKKQRAPRKQKETVERESQPSDEEKPKKSRAPRKQKETVEGESLPSDGEKPKKPRAPRKQKEMVVEEQKEELSLPPMSIEQPITIIEMVESNVPVQSKSKQSTKSTKSSESEQSKESKVSSKKSKKQNKEIVEEVVVTKEIQPKNKIDIELEEKPNKSKTKKQKKEQEEHTDESASTVQSADSNATKSKSEQSKEKKTKKATKEAKVARSNDESVEEAVCTSSNEVVVKKQAPKRTYKKKSVDESSDQSVTVEQKPTKGKRKPVEKKEKETKKQEMVLPIVPVKVVEIEQEDSDIEAGPMDLDEEENGAIDMDFDAIDTTNVDRLIDQLTNDYPLYIPEEEHSSVDELSEDEQNLEEQLLNSFSKFSIDSDEDNESEDLNDKSIEDEYSFNPQSPDYFPKKSLDIKVQEKLPTLLTKSDVGPRAIKPYIIEGGVTICTTLTMQDEEDSVESDTANISKLSNLKNKNVGKGRKGGKKALLATM